MGSKLTAHMLNLLKTLDAHDRAPLLLQKHLFPADMTQAEKNAVRALRSRGMAYFDADILGWRITITGRAALTGSDRT